MQPRISLTLCLLTILCTAPVLSDPLGRLQEWISQPASTRGELGDQAFAGEALTSEQAKQAGELLVNDRLKQIREARSHEWNDRLIVMGDKNMKWQVKVFGEKPRDGYSLLISMHGGGGAPADVNEQQWKNQLRLYELKEGIVIAPRAPTDNWNLWHEAHIDPMFDRLIEDAIAIEGVNPNRIFLTGYSAGGDGTYQLAPRMADRFAGAAMMAGHPNEASPLGLRNLPFAIHMGALDSAYNRNKVAADWGRKLDDLQKADPQGYIHQVKLHEGKGHWMDRQDREGIEWIMGFTRNPYPRKVVWKQDDVTHTRLYWLSVPPDQAKPGAEIVASISGQTIDVEKAQGVTRLTVLLNDALLDLDQPVTVRVSGRVIFEGRVSRTAGELAASLDARVDPATLFSAAIPIKID